MQHGTEPNAHPIYRVLQAQGRKGSWLAAKTGVSQSYVSLMIRGKRPAYPEFRAACAAALGGLPVEVLFHTDHSTVSEGQAA